MRILGKKFMAEEVCLGAALTTFFLWIFFGAFRYAPEPRLFPLILSTPALALLVLYFGRGALPLKIQAAIASNDRFAIGKSAEEKAAGSEADLEEKADNQPSFDPGAYVVFAFVGIFSILSHLVGFYLATPISIAGYLATVRQPMRKHVVIGSVLVALTLALIALFDSAFGHHFGNGKLLSVF